MKAPIVLITFNRPLLTKQVFNVISKAKPSVLFLISDGPRNGAERKLVEETRQIISLIDWPCKVFRKYSDVNLGCKISVSSGLDWVFSRADRAIILEDDCVPDPSFFTFCDDLLDKYEDNPKIMHITGSFLLGNNSVSKDSYYFSHFTSVWGWATWRRAWTKYDVAIKDWQNNSQIVLNQTLKDRRSRDFMNKRFEQVYLNKIDTWDYQWIYTCWKNSGLAISPTVNMIKNIGFNKSATHTKFESKFSNIPAVAIQYPLKHPQDIIPNEKADHLLQKYMYPESLFFDLVKIALRKLLHQ